MEITYQKLLELYQSNHAISDFVTETKANQPIEFDAIFKNKMVGLNNVLLKEQLEVFYFKETLLRVHQICQSTYNGYLTSTVNSHALNMDQLKAEYKVIMESNNPLTEPYVQILFPVGSGGFRVSLVEGHRFGQKVSCYYWELIKILMNESSVINLVSGKKSITSVHYDIVMLQCTDTTTGKITYYDLVENPSKTINLPVPNPCP